MWFESNISSTDGWNGKNVSSISKKKYFSLFRNIEIRSVKVESITNKQSSHVYQTNRMYNTRHTNKIIRFWLINFSCDHNEPQTIVLGGAPNSICHFYSVHASIQLSICLSFSKIFIFGVVRLAKGQKIVEIDKKFCLPHSISQEPYIMIFIHVTHV